MTKVALISPGVSARFAASEPLNLAYIAAYLERHGIDVCIIDQLAGDNVREAILRYKPDIAGITATTPVSYDAYEIADFCRKMKIPTVIGGVHAAVFPEEALRHADMVVRGEGEQAMLDIAMGRTSGGGIISGNYMEDIESLPFPARHLLKMERYIYCKKYTPILHLSYVPRKARFANIFTSRGCPHSECIFCHNSFKRYPYRAHSAGKVIEEIKLLKKDYDIAALYYLEDDFWSDKKRVVEICERLIKERLDTIIWGASARADQIFQTESEVLELAKRAGCRAITIGFESGSPRIIEVLKKGFKLEEAYAAAEKIRRAGLIMHGNIILGAPGETLDDIALSKQFIKKTAMVMPEVYIFTPYPGTYIWNKLSSEGKIPENLDWRRFNQEESILNFSDIPLTILNRLRTQIYLYYYITHPRRGAELLLNMLRHPGVSVDKIINTLRPFLKSFFISLRSGPRKREQPHRLKNREFSGGSS